MTMLKFHVFFPLVSFVYCQVYEIDLIRNENTDDIYQLAGLLSFFSLLTTLSV